MLFANDYTLNCRGDISKIYISWDEETGELAAQWVGSSNFILITDSTLQSLWERYPIKVSLAPHKWDVGKRVRLFEWQFNINAYSPTALIWTLQRIEDNGETLQA